MKLRGNHKPSGENKALLTLLSSEYTKTPVEKRLCSSQYKRPLYYVGVKWLRWSFCFVGGRHKAEGDCCGQRCVTGQRGGCAVVCSGATAVPLSSSANCAGCVFKSYKGTSVKERFTCVGSAWGMGKLSQYIVPFKRWFYFQSHWAVGICFWFT